MSAVTLKIQKYLKENIRAAEDLCLKTRLRPTEQDVYKLRVALRRIRVVLSIIKANGLETLPDREQKTLSEIWKALGKERDLVIAIENLKKLDLDPVSLKKSSKVAKKKLLLKLNQKNFNSVFSLLKKISSNPRLRNIKFDPFIKELRTKLAKDVKSQKEIHGFRILLKHVRYFFESMGEEVRDLKEFQTKLGDFNDFEVLLKLYGKNPKITKIRNKRLKAVKTIISPSKNLVLKRIKAVQSIDAQRF